MINNWKKNVVLFLVSQTLSLFGSSLVQYAIMWYITLNTKSGVMMTISIICGFVPTFFLSPFAGVWADRYNRKILIMLSDAFIAIATLLLAILFLLGYDSLGLLFVMSAFRAIGSGIQTPAIGAFIPQIVPEDQLTRVNGINGSIQAMVMLISPMLSGALLTMATIETIFFIDVFTAAIAVLVLLFFLKVPAHTKAQNQEKIDYFKDLQAGIIYIRNQAYVRKFFVFCAFFFFLVAPVAFLTPLQVTRSFGEDVWRLTAIEITFSVGMMLGGVIMASWGGFSNKVFTMTLSSFVIGICTLALGVVPIFWLYLLIMGIVGIAMPFFNTPSTVLLQEKVDPDYLGRVFGVMGMISSSMMPLGMLVFGPMADVIQIELLLIGTGFLLFIQSFFLIGSKDLVEAGKPKGRIS
ncbi:MAG: transporter [Anaerosolibacter sp.]|jgi:DHA3 family macrolide efflux protein-like MFS transporter|uniref:MFS transporter n=1 Tax=Anaerosolibacter sp. TaxID=1872527 RepID=UPI002606CB47|nr:MFS transporter [Anaerosolibacter sp.]MDF2545146.1 transporter [Anaerosolibacter sp.]